MTTKSATDQPEGPPIGPPPFKGLREVRLAVVMYGGVSLAIYMNGVAQELLRLVKATAPMDTDAEGEEFGLPVDKLQGSERVYRWLGQMSEAAPRPPEEIDDEDPILTRFVIDVLSGTSAGGINAVFLAKALANEQSMDALKNLWIEEGAIEKLLNDKESIDCLPLAEQNPPRSLLNGERMYLKLLDAFDGMDRDDPKGRSEEARESRYASELDLWVTMTDLAGLTLPIRLENRLIFEDRYRNVVHFAYSTDEATEEHRNDFHAGNNPFLAFVSRCTSSFPFAFEPMVLKDIDSIIPSFPGYRDGTFTSESERWERFYRDYRSDEGGPSARPDSVAAQRRKSEDAPELMQLPFRRRAFGDGGALDNKPFSYATKTLLRRVADFPVDRKLIFVEPDPGHPERARAAYALKSEPIGRESRPDALQNFFKQGVNLPRQEVIRDDLQVIADRNRVIRRIDETLRRVEVAMYVSKRAAWENPTDDADSKQPVSRSRQDIDKDVTDDLERRGLGYTSYHRIRVEALTDDLAKMMARVVGIPEDSEYSQAIRYLVAAWRDDACVEYELNPGVERPKSAHKPTLNQWLYEFDLRYRLRRLNFLQRKIDQLYRLNDEARELLWGDQISYWPESEDDKNAFRQELLQMKRTVNDMYRALRKAGRDIRKPPGATGQSSGTAPGGARADSIHSLIADLKLDKDLLLELLSKPSERARTDRAKAIVEDPERREAFKNLAERLRNLLATPREEARRLWAEALARPRTHPAVRAIRLYLRNIHDRFEDYDMVAFPLIYGTDVGEADIVEVIRISPEDAPKLIDVSIPNGRTKVTGAGYMHFGAFLDRLWRENDMLWGRLDAAEILIDSIVAEDQTDPQGRQAIVDSLRDEAHREIIAEELSRQDRDRIIKMLADALDQTSPEDASNAANLRQLVDKAAGAPVNERLQAVLQAVVVDKQQLLDYYRDSYQVDRRLVPSSFLRSAGRGAHIMGRVFQTIAKESRQEKLASPFAWVARGGSLFSGMVEAAVPGTFRHLLWRHWLTMLYLFELFLFAGGLVFQSTPVQRVGLLALVVTFAVNMAILILGNRIRGGPWWSTAGKAILLVTVLLATAGVITLAVFQLFHLGREYPWIPVFGESDNGP